MIPRTYPSRVNSTTGRVEALVSFISSTTGLQRWVDYTPVAFVTDATPVEGSYDNDGYIAVADVGSTTGLQAGKDYIRVFLDPNATDAWRVNSVGFIPVGYSGIGGIPYALFANNEQGVWYDPSDINLAWRRNLLTYTEQFDNAAWAKVRTTVGANAVLAPDGTTTADKIVATSASGSHYVSQGGTQAVVTASVLAKAAEYGVLQIAAAVAGDQFANFDLVVGVLGSVGAGATNASITSVGNGWYLCQCSFAITSSIGAIFAIAPLKTSGWLPSFVGDDTSGIYLWGAQLEVGSTASTYQRITDGVQDYYAYQAQPVLFQDSAGTTPVTAVEQPVGLMLDKSKGLVLGSEKNPGLANYLNVLTGTWAASGGNYVFTDTVGGQSRPGVQWPDVGGTLPLPVGWYQVTVVVASITGATQVRLDGIGATDRLLTVGTNSFIANVTSLSRPRFRIEDLSTTIGDGFALTSVSFRELPGNHAFQATSTSRPVLSARYNLLTKTEQFDDAAWVKTGTATVTANQGTAPNGTTTADKVEFGAIVNLTDFHFIAQTQTLDSATYSGIVYVKAFSAGDVGKKVWLWYWNGSANVADTAVTLTADWQAITPTATALTSGSRIFRVGVAGPNILGTGAVQAAVTALIWGADLRVTNDAAGQPVYQRVNTATDYDTTGFKPYLRFDGTDDWLQTNSINFTGTDKMTVFAGVRKLTNQTLATGASIMVEFSADRSTNNGVFTMALPLDGNNETFGYAFANKGTLSQTTQVIAGYPAPRTNVLTGIGDISGDSAILRVNGSQVASNTADQGTGNYGNYPLYIGRRGGTTLPFNGRLYGLIVRGAATTTATIQATETYMNGKTGAY